MTNQLRRRGYCVNHKRTTRIMRDSHLVCVMERKRIRTTLWSAENPPLPDLVNQYFAPGVPDVAGCGDITYVPIDEGLLYLGSVLDLGSRRLMGWATYERMPTALVATALDRTVEQRGESVEGVIIHSDRGSQAILVR